MMKEHGGDHCLLKAFVSVYRRWGKVMGSHQFAHLHLTKTAEDEPLEFLEKRPVPGRL